MDKIVERDHDRFKHMYSESRAVIPKEYSAPLDNTPIRTLIRNRGMSKLHKDALERTAILSPCET